MSQEALIQKAMQTFRKKGIGDLLRETWRYAGRRLLPYEPAAKLFALSAILAIRRLDRNDRDVVALTNFMFDRFAGLIRPAQIRSEITSLANIVRDLRPKAVIEIGTAKGGTLFLFSRLADPCATLVSIDLPGGEFGGGYPTWKARLYRSFCLPQQTMHLLRADSSAIITIENVKSILGETPVDFLFIDGNHTYEGVKKDFELYSPFVRKGGLIAFHDIAVHPPESRCNVDKFWKEARNQHSRELIENQYQQWAGIGVYPVV
jgi:predicted O-methyltransferase YrrM